MSVKSDSVSSSPFLSFSVMRVGLEDQITPRLMILIPASSFILESESKRSEQDDVSLEYSLCKGRREKRAGEGRGELYEEFQYE